VAAATVALDFDGVLVHDGLWLPGAPDAIRWLWERDALVIIHSCRANSPDGVQMLEHAVADLGVAPRGPRGGSRILIHTGQGKPHADAYVDDKAVRFGGWPYTLHAPGMPAL
jgi:hypothetical protein